MRRSVPSKAQVQCWTVSREPAEPESGTAFDAAPRTDPLHGYTLADLEDIARLALWADRWNKACDTRDRYAAIRDGIVECLLTARTPPSRRDLVTAGMHAADLYVRSEMHHHGLSLDHIGEAMARFERYWVTSPTPSPEQGVVDRLALAQILPRLTRAQRDAITALAWYEDYGMAAKACGTSDGNFRVHVSAARRRFFALWHEGESPAGQWRTDRRVYERETTRTHDARGRRRLNEVELEALRERYNAGGTTLTALAAEAGVHKSTLSALLSGRTRPARAKAPTDKED